MIVRVMTLVTTSDQVVETSVNAITKGPSQDYTHPDDHNLPTYGTFYPVKIRETCLLC